MKLLAFCMRELAALLRLLPLKRRVALLSRQSDEPSLDYRLLIEELRRTLNEDEVVVCLTEPETKSKLGFAWGTLKQLYYACTSTVIVVDGYVPAVSIPKKDDRVTVIQMWHALGAIKKFGYQCLDTPAGRTSESARVARMHRNYDLIIAGGPGAVPAYAEAFNYPEDRILPVGLPRIDYLLDDSPASPRREAMDRAARTHPFLASGRRIVLYAPTLRKGAEYEASWLNGYVWDIAQHFHDPEALLVVAAHPLSGTFDAVLERDFPFVKHVPGVPTIDLLGFADEIITDYSAIAFEAGLLGKPVRFYTPDIERYRASPGLNIEPDELTPDFFQRYFDGVGPGATTRIAGLVLDALDK